MKIKQLIIKIVLVLIAAFIVYKGFMWGYTKYDTIDIRGEIPLTSENRYDWTGFYEEVHKQLNLEEDEEFYVRLQSYRNNQGEDVQYREVLVDDEVYIPYKGVEKFYKGSEKIEVPCKIGRIENYATILTPKKDGKAVVSFLSYGPKHYCIYGRKSYVIDYKEYGYYVSAKDVFKFFSFLEREDAYSMLEGIKWETEILFSVIDVDDNSLEEIKKEHKDKKRFLISQEKAVEVKIEDLKGRYLELQIEGFNGIFLGKMEK